MDYSLPERAVILELNLLKLSVYGNGGTLG